VAKQTRAKSQATEPIFYSIHIDSMTGHRAAPDATDLTFLEISGS